MRQERKVIYDKKHRTQEQEKKTGDKVLVKQQKTTIKPPFDTRPHHVKEVRGTKIIVVRGNQHKVRSKEKVKLLRDRFKKGSFQEEKIDQEGHWYINLQVKPQEDTAEERLEEDTETPEGEVIVPAAQLDQHPQVQAAKLPQITKKSGRQEETGEKENSLTI